MCVDDLLSKAPKGASVADLRALIKTPKSSALYLSYNLLVRGQGESQEICSTHACGKVCDQLFGDRCWQCFVKPAPPNKEVQPHMGISHCGACSKPISDDMQLRFEGKCWECYTFVCSACPAHISKTSFKELGGKCWKCYLAQENLFHALPCKNLTAAHVACTRTRTAGKGSLYCEQCSKTMTQSETVESKVKGRLCRNRASACSPCSNNHTAQHHNYGFCKACAGEAAGPLCLNYTNPRVRCGNRSLALSRNSSSFCDSCSKFILDPTEVAPRK